MKEELLDKLASFTLLWNDKDLVYVFALQIFWVIIYQNICKKKETFLLRKGF